MDTSAIFRSLGIALGLGLLVGLQRQWSGSKIAGVRTFPIVAISGALAALLARDPAAAPAYQLGAGGAWIIGAGVIVVGSLAIVANILAARDSAHRDPGMTTEIALVAMFLLGAYSTIGPPAVVAAVGAGMAILLHAKTRLHDLASRLGEQDQRAIMLFAAITFVVLPVLPNEVILKDKLGDLAVWNPRNIWLMVVLVTGLSLVGYIAYKLIAGRMGLALTGILGGLISSTATTFSIARRTRDTKKPGASAAALAIIAIAGGVVYARLFVAIGFVAPGFLREAGPPLGIMMGVSAAISLVLLLRHDGRADGLGEPKNPAQFKAALVFAGLYALVLLAVAITKREFGQWGLYVVAAISGLTDMDAITISNARMVAQQALDPGIAWRAILIAAIANTIFKTGVVAATARGPLLKGMAAVSAIKITTAVALIVLWPAAQPPSATTPS